jgi:enoyl-CoA hydratase
MSSQVQVELTKPIATVLLERVERHSLLDPDGWREVAATFRDLSARREVTCVVVCGTGGPLSAVGGSPASLMPRPSAAGGGGDSDAIASALRAVRSCEHATVAIVEGVCVGGGLAIAASCDLRVCGEASRFGGPMSGADLGASYDGPSSLEELLGASPVLERLARGELIDATQASRFGLVNRVYADASVREQGYGLAARIAAGAPLVNRWHKGLIRRLRDRWLLTSGEGTELPSDLGLRAPRVGDPRIEKRDLGFRGH